MKKRLLITMTALMLVAVTMMAVPAKPGLKKKVTLKNGTTVELSLKGDEHFSYYTDAAGKPCKLKNGELITLTHEEVAEQWTALREQRLAIGNSSSRRARRAGEPGTTTGNQKGLVILLQYQDVKFLNDSLTTNQIFKRFFNEEGYKEYGNEGSVRDYFKKQSYGKLNIDFDVVGPFTVSHKMEYYGKHYTDDQGNEHNDTHPAIMVAEAVDSAYKAGVNFSNYDWDGDKEVDQVFVIYAGYAEAQGAAPETIWPHEWSLSAEGKTKKYNGVTINTYGCASELSGKSGSDLDGIGTACHEFTHCLGLPDMYDTQGDNYGMAYWDVMCAGSYNDDSHTPAGYTAYERWFSGWMEPTELKEQTSVVGMKPLVNEPEAYILYNDKNRNEYYILENRQPVSFDKGLYGHGLLIYHVDYNESAWNHNQVNIVANHQRMVIVPADNEFNDLSALSLAGDPWPGTKGNTMLSNYSTPAATLYNENTDGSKLLNKQIDNITENTETMTVSFVACRPEMPVPSADEATEQIEGNSLTISWPAVEKAVSYEVEWTIKDKAPSTPEKALMYESDLAKFESKSASFTPIKGSLDNYGLKSWTADNLFTTPNKMRFGTSTSTGTLKSPWWYTPSSTHATLVLGANIVKNSVKGTVTYSNGDVEDGYVRDIEEVGVEDFEVTGDQKLVVHLKNMNKAAYQFLIAPKTQMYLNYLAIYDGIWTAEQLGINSSSAVPRRAVTTDIRSTPTNSITMEVDINKIYTYRIRSLDAEGFFSAWSSEKTFDLETTGIQSISTKVNTDNTVRYFDLQGREVNGATKGLLIRKQGNNVTKVMVK